MKQKIFDGVIALVVLWSIYLLVKWNIDNPVATSGWGNLKYFTVQSNILMGLVSLANCIRGKEYPYLTFAGTVSVALTALIVIIFLGPLFGFAIMYVGFNLYMHAIVPALAIIRFIVFRTGDKIEKNKIWTGVIPMFVYGIGYVANILINGLSRYTDWYGFALFGTWSIIPAFAIILGITYMLSVLIRKIGSSKLGKEE